MGYRNFVDGSGVQWQAWDVVPRLIERRTGSRRSAPMPMGSVNRREGRDRRVSDRRPALSDGLGQGWLCFESAAEKRRLTPIPQDWLACGHAQLEAYCRMASPVRRPAPDPLLGDAEEAKSLEARQ